MMARKIALFGIVDDNDGLTGTIYNVKKKKSTSMQMSSHMSQ
jgi:hypothetical protein